MTRRERLMATLRGEPVDRPPVCFYEIDGINQDEHNDDPFNIYTHPSWHPLLKLAREQSDAIARSGASFKNTDPSPLDELTETENWIDNSGRKFSRTTIRAGKRKLTRLTRRDPDVNTVWTLEHLVKDEEDFLAWLDLPEVPFSGEPDTSKILEYEERVGDGGIAMIDKGDSLCRIAPLFSMEEFTIVALTRPDLMHRGLEKVQRLNLAQTEAIAKALPGRLWRVVGPEYASPPYLPPNLFEEYVTRYDTPLVAAIQEHGGYARIHSHGRLKDVLDMIAATGCVGLDPIEPPGQGDVELSYVREKYGEQMVLFGNIEASDLENLPTPQFREKIATALKEGTQGRGRGFVLMPSACPYGRELATRSLHNYEAMIEMANEF